MLNTSESTVRRDLDELEGEKKLRRVHGGAECLTPPRGRNHSRKIYQKPSREKAIAHKAADLIQEQDVIFIDAGTTTCLVNQ